MKRTYIGRVLHYEMQRAKLTQSALAAKASISQPTLSQIVATDVRIAPASLQALTHCWPTPETNGRVLIAHLRDEISRAGHDAENSVEIRWPNGDKATTQASRSLEVIQQHLSDPDVAAIVQDLAILLKRSDSAKKYENKQPRIDQAAEPPESYLGQN